MRTEIKIGVAAAAFIALVALLYCVLLTDWDSKDKETPVVEADAREDDSRPGAGITIETLPRGGGGAALPPGSRWPVHHSSPADAKGATQMWKAGSGLSHSLRSA